MKRILRFLVTAIFLAGLPALVAAAALALLADGALAREHCGLRVGIVAALNGKYQERLHSFGMLQHNAKVELFVSATGTWTVLVSTPSGRSCIVAVGSAWEVLPQPVPGRET
jgi:hypothetical protein